MCINVLFFLLLFLSLPDILAQPISKHVKSSVVSYSPLYYQEREREREREREGGGNLPLTCVFNLNVYSIILLWALHILAIQHFNEK